MSVICFASLKGGVGKTSLAINVAHAFAVRGCRTLLIDFDPSGHSSRFFERGRKEVTSEPQNFQQNLPFVRFMLGQDESPASESELIKTARPDLDFIRGGHELRHLYFGRGAQNFSRRFLPLIKELRYQYDHILIDTCPDFNVLTRNALAASDLAVVPVDASEMSIHSLEELLQGSQHIKRPTWCVIRTMVNKKAKHSQSLSDSRLHARLAMQSPSSMVDGEESDRYDIENPYDFMKMLQDWEKENGQSAISDPQPDSRPIYLLRSMIYRTEKQNQLSFTGLTSFDAKASAVLAEQYLNVARELEALVGGDGDLGDDGFERESGADDDSGDSVQYEARAAL